MELIKTWLVTFVPHWSGFTVCGASKYLGIFLGPSAGTTQWSLPLEKWSSRAATITDVGASAAIAANLYNSRAVTTMSYVAQLRPLPKAARAIERKIVNRILRVPGNSFAKFGKQRVFEFRRDKGSLVYKHCCSCACSSDPHCNRHCQGLACRARCSFRRCHRRVTACQSTAWLSLASFLG